MDRGLVNVLVIMGVSGSGKTTVGRLLAVETGATFVDGDDYHPPANVRKMAAGLPLSDEDRSGWLETLADVICDARRATIIACSALKEDYRKILKGARFVYLKGSPDLLLERMSGRSDHFMPLELLASQLETLESPDEALTLDIRESPEELVAQIREHLRW